MIKSNKFLYKTIIIVLLSICTAAAFAGCGTENRTKIGPLKEGKNSFFLNGYNISRSGLSQLEKLLRKCVILPEKIDVNYFDAEISKNADMKNFSLSLYGFDADNNFTGSYSFVYNAAMKTMIYEASNPGTSITYNKNRDISYLDSEIKLLPLSKQIWKLFFPKYVLSFQSNTKLSSGQPVIDKGTGKNFPVLSLSDYKKGAGGKSDGHTAVIFTLYDGVSIEDANKIYYRCKPADSTSLYGNHDFTMQCDYMISNNKLSFTRDYGETWIPSGLSEDDLSDTLSFYNNGSSLPEGSYFISPNADIPIAFFYGNTSTPELHISKDNGKTWHESCPSQFNKNKENITKRFVGFIDKNEGYVGLGTDWSMGTGEDKLCYMTHDGGSTWVEKNLPLSGTSSTLNGICFSDKNNGIVSLKSPSDDPWPILYFTQDGAGHWAKTDMPWKSLPGDDVYSLSKIDSLTCQNGTFTLTLGQGLSGKKRLFSKAAAFQADGLW